MYPSLIEIGSKTAEKNSAQTNRQTNQQTPQKNNGHLAVNQHNNSMLPTSSAIRHLQQTNKINAFRKTIKYVYKYFVKL